MPAAIAIPAIIGAAGSVGAAAIQSHQGGKAVKAQTAAGEKANSRLDPYATAGYGAVSNLQGLVGRPAPAANLGGGTLASMAAPAQGSAGMITVKAPTGDTQQVPANQSGYWQSKGAQVI